LKDGRAGFGDIGDKSQFTQISAYNSNISKISASDWFGIALRNGTIVLWGKNQVNDHWFYLISSMVN
jgi:hypothetical protein